MTLDVNVDMVVVEAGEVEAKVKNCLLSLWQW